MSKTEIIEEYVANKLEKIGKKKSEYQKLLDLLNEYENPMVSWYEEYDEVTGFFILNQWQKVQEEVILGKTYWFIEWLVRNDNIDFKKLDTPRFNQLIDNTLDSYLALLMLLAIQDEPVRFISKLLK